MTLAALFEPLFSGGTLLPSSPAEDMQARTLPLRAFGFGELRAGRLALWNPHSFCGIPNFGGFESALLYPFNWLHLIFSLGSATNLLIALHVFLAGFFCFLWARGRGVSAAGATLAGAVFMLGGSYFPHIYPGHLGFLCVTAWAPLIFRAVEERSRAWRAVGMAAVALQVLAGNPQAVYFTALAAVLVAFERRSWTGLLAIYGGGAALSAVQWLTGLQAASESIRAGLGYGAAPAFALPPENLITVVAPGLWGGLSGFPYFGRGYLWDSSLFIGGGAATLALAAIFSNWKAARAPLGAAGVLILLSLGARTPIYALLCRALPWLAQLRGTDKFNAPACLFLALLAGMGLDAARGEKKGARRAAGIAAGAGILLLLAGLFLYGGSGERAWTGVLAMFSRTNESFLVAAHYREPEFLRLCARLGASEILGAASALMLASLFLLLRRHSERWTFALAFLVGAELLRFARQSVTTSPSDAATAPELRRVLAAAPGDDRFLYDWTLDPRVRPNLGLALGRDEIGGFDPLVLRRYAEFMAFSQGADLSHAEANPVIARVSPLFRLLRLRYVFSGEDGRLARELPDVLPRFLLLSRYRVIPGRADLLRAMSGADFDARREALLESAPDPAPQEGALADAQIKLMKSSTDALELSANLPRPAILLVTDAYSAGWRATAFEDSAQKRYDVLPADYVLRAVPLGAGRHHFQLEYRPAAFRLGAAVSILSLVVYAVFCLGWLI